MSRIEWSPGQPCQVTGAMGGQVQRAVVVGPDPKDPQRVEVRYTNTGQVRSLHRGRLRSAA